MVSCEPLFLAHTAVPYGSSAFARCFHIDLQSTESGNFSVSLPDRHALWSFLIQAFLYSFEPRAMRKKSIGT